VRFEWDRRKAASNLRKHHVTFEEATTVFRNPLARIFPDQDHAPTDNRELMVGHAVTGRLLIVAFTERAPGVVRIISARQTTRRETHDYEESRKS
jgi:uncharacterized DUF497 family protein